MECEAVRKCMELLFLSFSPPPEPQNFFSHPGEGYFRESFRETFRAAAVTSATIAAVVAPVYPVFLNIPVRVLEPCPSAFEPFVLQDHTHFRYRSPTACLLVLGTALTTARCSPFAFFLKEFSLRKGFPDPKRTAPFIKRQKPHPLPRLSRCPASG